jgi:predicted outer membrane repeat protein
MRMLHKTGSPAGSIVACSAVLVLALAAQLRAETAILNADGTGDYPDIQSAVDALPDGGSIYLLPGYYCGLGNRGVVLGGKNISFAVFGAPGSAVIDCQGGERAFDLGAGVDSTTVFDGIAFLNGTARSGSGGAIDCSSAGPTIQDCTFTGNSATYGGAVRAYGEPGPIIRGCVFTGNSALYGGALDARESTVLIENSTFGENSASRGGALNFLDSTSTVTRCTLCRNSAAHGAAIRLEGSTAQIARCIVAFNRTNEAILGEETSETSYCCLFDNADGNDVDGNAHDNTVLDPLFCDVIGGDYHLCLNSYCLPSNNPWTMHIGHQAQGCGECTSPATETSWGTLKALYR